MAEPGGAYPSVFVVDSHASYPPPVPPRPSRKRRGAGVAQTLLFLLVSLALCGMAIESYFIYRLYHPEASALASKIKQDGDGVVTGKQILKWSVDSHTLLHDMKYKNGKLAIQKEGYYYVYSKVFFTEDSVFHHSVKVATQVFQGKSITLLESRKYSQKGSQTVQSNSYLGGVFHLRKGDSLYVEVSDYRQVVQFRPYDNYFGAYMI
ncbi:tumor necrosis factor ligand superfamily member 14 [Diretmus argenteus]